MLINQLAMKQFNLYPKDAAELSSMTLTALCGGPVMTTMNKKIFSTKKNDI